MPVLLSTSCVTLGRLLDVSDPPTPLVVVIENDTRQSMCFSLPLGRSLSSFLQYVWGMNCRCLTMDSRVK